MVRRADKDTASTCREVLNACVRLDTESGAMADVKVWYRRRVFLLLRQL